MLNDQLIGTIALYHTEPGCYTDDHRRLLERVAEQAAAVVNNSILFEQTKRDSLTDPLTGLPNTRFMFVHLTRELARAERLDTEVSLLVMDLDGFKEINDSHGHHIGDKALREVARVLRNGIRPYDICVRYAGDEFVVVLSGCGAIEAEQKQRELQKAIEEISFEVRPGKMVHLGGSFGYAVFPRDGQAYESLLSTADRRMYQDKAARKGRAATCRPKPRPRQKPRRRPLVLRCLLRCRDGPPPIARTDLSPVASPRSGGRKEWRSPRFAAEAPSALQRMLQTAIVDRAVPATPRSVLRAADARRALLLFSPDKPRSSAPSDSRLRRPYSIAVGPAESSRDRALEFLIGLGPDGAPGPHLPDLSPGTQRRSRRAARIVRVPRVARRNELPVRRRRHRHRAVAGHVASGAGAAIRRGESASSTARARPTNLRSTTSSARLPSSGRLTYVRTVTRHSGGAWEGGLGPHRSRQCSRPQSSAGRRCASFPVNPPALAIASTIVMFG